MLPPRTRARTTVSLTGCFHDICVEGLDSPSACSLAAACGGSSSHSMASTAPSPVGGPARWRWRATRRSARRLPTRASGSRPVSRTPARRSGTCRGVGHAPSPSRRSTTPIPTWRSHGTHVIQGNYNGFQIWDIVEPGAAEAAGRQALPGVAERRVGVPEPAVRVGRGADGPPRLRRAGAARDGQQGPDSRRPHLRHQRHQQSEVRHQRPDLPRLAHPHGGGRSERQGERLHLHLGHVGHPSRGANSPAAIPIRATRTLRSSTSRSSRYRSRIPSRPPS